MEGSTENAEGLASKRLLPALNKAGTPKRNKSSEVSPEPTPLQATPKNAESSGIVKTPKRNGYLSWDEYFLAVAILSSKRSKDPISPSGACIVDDQNRVVAVGYNGFPRGCSDSIFPWVPSENSSDLHSREPYVCHSITNAICNKCSDDVAGCRLYVIAFPSSDSAKVIIQSRIKEVIVLQREGSDQTAAEHNVDLQASRILLDMANVQVRYFKPSTPSVTLDFVSKLAPSTVPESESASSDCASGNAASDKLAEARARALLLSEANYDASKVEDNGRRKDYISWQDYFMAMAFLTAERSKDPNTQVGACIVDCEDRIIGLGYNGFPRGCSDDKLPWARANSNQLYNKYLYVCHAEVNGKIIATFAPVDYASALSDTVNNAMKSQAILNKGSANVKGAAIYVALFPCENCAKMIIQAGIREVVYMSDCYHNTDGARASRIMLQSAAVKLRHYIPSRQRLVLDF